MLAYTAVDSLRAISRDFDFNWQPTVNDELTTSTRRGGRNAHRVNQRLVWPSVVMLVALLAPGAAWAR